MLSATLAGVRADPSGAVRWLPGRSTVGRGGTGVIYRGTDPRLQRPVAIKLIASDRPPTTPSAGASSGKRGSPRRSSTLT